jgi:hypothetical protein
MMNRLSEGVTPRLLQHSEYECHSYQGVVGSREENWVALAVQRLREKLRVTFQKLRGERHKVVVVESCVHFIEFDPFFLEHEENLR